MQVVPLVKSVRDTFNFSFASFKYSRKDLIPSKQIMGTCLFNSDTYLSCTMTSLSHSMSLRKFSITYARTLLLELLCVSDLSFSNWFLSFRSFICSSLWIDSLKSLYSLGISWAPLQNKKKLQSSPQLQSSFTKQKKNNHHHHNYKGWIKNRICYNNFARNLAFSIYRPWYNQIL